MMKPEAIPDTEIYEGESVPFSDVVLISVPADVYKRISDAAAKRHMTTAQALSSAVSEFLKEPEGPRLLVE